MFFFFKNFSELLIYYQLHSHSLFFECNFYTVHDEPFVMSQREVLFWNTECQALALFLMHSKCFEGQEMKSNKSRIILVGDCKQRVKHTTCNFFNYSTRVQDKKTNRKMGAIQGLGFISMVWGENNQSFICRDVRVDEPCQLRVKCLKYSYRCVFISNNLVITLHAWRTL